ncbi:unnamed protein product [Pleuronectes platessa]|uniref:Uncharacterized protein n=1 Tax=Pleuronectes platessa TaxID=8262 RepID=A0A9N7V2S0_PLEPL|nr:unnamed protein product [Pleuronectes platessa]
MEEKEFFERAGGLLAVDADRQAGIRTPACFSTFWLSGALRSQAGEWRGHIRGSFRAPTHYAAAISPPCISHHPNPRFSLFPSDIPSSFLPLQLISPLTVTGGVRHTGGGTGTRGVCLCG